MTARRRSLLIDWLDLELQRSRRALHEGTGIRECANALNDLTPVANRLHTLESDHPAQSFAAAYWSHRANIEFNVGRASEALTHADIAESFYRGLGSAQVADIARIKRLQAVASAMLGSTLRATDEAQRSVEWVADDRYLSARGRYTAIAVARQARLHIVPEEWLSDADIAEVSAKYSPSLGAAGALLRFKARAGWVDPSRDLLLRDLEIAQELMRSDPDERLIQEAQVEECRSAYAVICGDETAAVASYRHLVALAARMAGQDSRLARAKARLIQAFDSGG